MNSFYSVDVPVLHVGKFYPPHMGGIETYLRNLVKEQSRRQIVEVLVANEKPQTNIEYADGARITRLASFGTLSSMPLCPSLPWKLALRNSALVHVHLPNPWAAFSLLASGRPGKVILSHHSDTLGRPRLRKISDPFVYAAMKKADAIIVSSARYLDSSEELKPFKEKCHIVPYGIDPTPFDSARANEVQTIREQYGSKLILSVGRLVAYKGFDYLIRAMRDVDAVLLIIGTAPLEEALRKMIGDLGLQGKVHLLGHAPEILPYFKAAQMFVLPSVSRAEAFGIVQLEAMAAGTPVINTDIDSGVPEVSLHGITGLTVPPRDSASLSQAICTLLHNPELCRQYGQHGAARVRQHFSLRQMVDSTFQLYSAILEGPRVKPTSGAAA